MLKKIFLLVLNLVGNVFCAEMPPAGASGSGSSKVIILDLNQGGSIKKFISDSSSIINVFGATPRYSAFQRYKIMLQDHFNSLANQFLTKKGKRLKGVESRVENFINSIADAGINLKTFNSTLANLDDKQFFNLFFANGFDMETMQENFKSLLQASMKTQLQDCKSRYLVHVLLPCYFTDLHSDTNHDDVYRFLKHAAVFYKNIYEQFALASNLKICILIPQLKYFSSAIVLNEACDKGGINFDVIANELVKPLGLNYKYVFIDQDIDELKLFIQKLLQYGVPQVVGLGLQIFNSRGAPTTIFNAYTIKADGNYEYQTSPILNQQLLEYILKNYKAENKPEAASSAADEELE
jgi:hypothetical protein